MAKYRKYANLTDLHDDWGHVIATAHRGASGCYPENTLLSMRKAIEWGTDFIEFDLRATKDGVPVLLHDSTLDRTSNLKGRPEDYTLAQLKEGNFSYYLFGPAFNEGKKAEKPVYASMEIPTFEEVLRNFRGQAAMNIQIYLDSEIIGEVCRLYREYQMYDQAYLTIARPEDVELVRRLDPAIEICFTPPMPKRGEPEQLKLCKEMGCRFVQPVAGYATEETFRYCRELGLRGNVFYSDTEILNDELIGMGATGIMSNRIDILVDKMSAKIEA